MSLRMEKKTYRHSLDAQKVAGHLCIEKLVVFCFYMQYLGLV